MVEVLMRVSIVELESTDKVNRPMQLSPTGRSRHPVNSTLWNGACFIRGLEQFHWMELADCHRAVGADNGFQRRTLAMTILRPIQARRHDARSPFKSNRRQRCRATADRGRLPESHLAAAAVPLHLLRLRL